MIDKEWELEALAMKEVGFNTSIMNDSFHIYPQPIKGETILYRGWMFEEEGYGSFIKNVESLGCKSFTTVHQYLNAHQLYRWYPILIDLTPETHFFSIDDELEGRMKALRWASYFVKTQTKSLNTGMGSILTDTRRVSLWVEEMKKYQGEIEGNLCVRKVEDFITDSETRYFVINGRAYGPRDEDIPPIVKEIIERLKRSFSKFYSIDIVERVDGVKRVVEIGDGQVSHIKEWSIDRFVNMILEGLGDYA